MIEEILADAGERMDSAFESFKKDLSGVRTGRASASMLDDIEVESYGTTLPLNQVATISVPEARLIVIQPWDKNSFEPIEKSIRASNLGLNPQNDGKLIRIPIPPLTEERRKDLVKQSRKKMEDAKVAVRNVRRDAKEMIEALEKDEDISKDEIHRAVEKLQGLTDASSAKIDALTATKEKEILEF